MRRFRILLLGVCVMLLGPAVFLIHRAVQSVDLENEMRHRIVAERVFDEMEGALNRLLEQEESHPFDPSGTNPEPAFRFIAGYFHIDPDGDIHVLASTHAPAGEVNAKELESTVEDYWRANQRGSAPAVSQRPGSTVEVGSGTDKGQREVDDLDALAGKNEVSAYGALRSLNKAVEEREARQQRAAAPYRRRDEVGVAAEALAPIIQPFESSPEPGRRQPPLSGRLAGPKYLMLSRHLLHKGQVYQQGLALNVAQLELWLRQQGLGGDGLSSYASLSLSPANGILPDVSPTPFSYRHRFAEPFADLTAQLDLQALPGTASLTYVYTLSGLLIAATVLGLTALYKMVSVIVGFAERKSNFVAAVSHELKTPLTAIRMYGEMLRDGMVSSDAKRNEYYRHITAESERLSRLINNVLEFSRLEKGNRELALVTGPVEPVLREVAELLGPHVQEQGFELQVLIDRDLPAFRFERDALMQVLWNLADNAVKYARNAVPKQIILRCRAEGGMVAVTVGDHGPGVAARHLDKIFDPFYRGENELTRSNKGTGLGLALVRGLAERMGATVTASNVAPGGFEVTVVFPPAETQDN